MARLMWLAEPQRQQAREKLHSAIGSWLQEWSLFFENCQIEEVEVINILDIVYYAVGEKVLVAMIGPMEEVIKQWLYGEESNHVPDDEIGQRLIDKAATDLLISVVSPFGVSSPLEKCPIEDLCKPISVQGNGICELWFQIEVNGISLKLGLCADLLLAVDTGKRTGQLFSRNQVIGRETVRVDVKAHLSQIPLSQVLGLQLGDVITSGIPLNHPLSVHLNENVVLKGFLGTAGEKKALNLTPIEK